MGKRVVTFGEYAAALFCLEVVGIVIITVLLYNYL
jgi:hypothetical protein